MTDITLHDVARDEVVAVNRLNSRHLVVADEAPLGTARVVHTVHRPDGVTYRKTLELIDIDGNVIGEQA